VGRPWDADLPVVVVPQSDQPKRVTFVYPYYMNPDFLHRQIDRWHQYAESVKAYLSLILVDDGSPRQSAADALEGSELPFPVRLFQIDVDVRWNWLAARNIGMYHAPDGWCLLTDMDHVVPPTTARALVYGYLPDDAIYGFSRVERTGEPLAAHPNSWFLTRRIFWEVGGYDERLSGHYGTDGDWRRRCAKVAPLKIVADRLVRHEYDGDSSTTRYLRKQPVDAAVKGIIAARKPGWAPKTLSFPYREVTL
jgi:hypothetical protein